MKSRYETLPRTVRFAASLAAVFCTAGVMAGIAGLADVEPDQLAQSAPAVVAQAVAGSQVR